MKRSTKLATAVATTPILTGDNHSHMSSHLLGDIFSGDTNDGQATITLANGTTARVPMEALGDIFSGDMNLLGDDESMGDDDGIGDIYGDSEVTHFAGDIFSGDRKRGGFMGGFLKNAPGDGVKMSKKPTKSQEATARVLKLIPGAVMATKNVSPLIINKGLINNAPTRNMIQGALFTDTLRRAETQYPGTTRTIVKTNVAGVNSLSFQFGLPANDPTPTGNITYAPVIFIQIATSRQFTVPNAEISIAVTGRSESGNVLQLGTWTVLLADQLESCFFAFVPFTEISSTLYPAIMLAKTDAADQRINVEVAGLPSNTNVRVVLPGSDSSQYQMFKQGFGISVPTTKAMSLTSQPR